MKSLLDRTITLRQLMICCIGTFALTMLVYIFLLLVTGWNMKMGGANYRNSPYVDLMPEGCKAAAGITGAGYSNDYAIDSLLLRQKVKRVVLSNPAQDFGGKSPLTCLGYTVMGGLHEREIGTANFAQRFEDKEGRPIVTVRVEYHQAHPYPPIDLINELKASQK